MTVPEVPRRSCRVNVGRGVAIRAVIHGRETGRPPLVLLHGFMGSAEGWRPLAQRLAAGRIVIAPDLPGHGHSSAPPSPRGYTVERVAEGLARLAEHLGAEGADWLGYSMGGRILLAGVAEGILRPGRMILESTSPGLEGDAARAERRAADEQRARRLIAEGVEAFVDDWLRLPLFATLPEAVRRQARGVRVRNRPEALAAALRGGGTGSQRPYWDRLAALPLPTLLITGERDEKFTGLARRMAALLPTATWTSVAGVGHAVHLEAPEEWLGVVEGWLAGVPASLPPAAPRHSPHPRDE